MTLKDALKKALEIIGDDDIDLESTSIPEGNLKKLISCGNMIYGELTEEYVYLRHSDEVSADGHKIYFDQLSKPLKEILRIKIGDRNIPYKVYPEYIYVGVIADTYKIIYTYHAEELSLTDEIILPPNFTVATLASGIASEYFYRSGLIDEALFYKNRYDNSLLNLTRKRHPGVVLYRRFI